MSTPRRPDKSPEADQEAREALLARRIDQRQRLLKRLWKEGADFHSERLEKCGMPVVLKCTCCNARRTVATRCDLKWCPTCAPRIANDRVRTFEDVVYTFKARLNFTLTTTNFSARSKKTTGMREVVRAFKRFRSQRWFERIVRGGVASFEMTRKKKGWHPHVHGILDCGWLAVSVPRPGTNCGEQKWKAACKAACEELASMWTMALGGRKGSVFLRRLYIDKGGVRGAMKDCLKYAVTAESLENMKGDVGLLLDELRFTRNVVGFGSAYKHPALKRRARDPQPCDSCGEFNTLVPAGLSAQLEALGRMASN